MIPVSLKIKGLYSYQEEQSIDFTRLMEAQLFGIFGTVGSGKSSVLEAISYALYGETERLNAKDGRAYNMMNLKSNELLIDFEFLISDNKYRCEVRSKRNKKNFEKVGTPSRTAYKQVAGEWEPIELSEIPKLLGLTYENFRRTIIIPQGKFQEFLHLSNKDRTTMLKEIFNLNKFELGPRVGVLDTANNLKIAEVEGGLGNFSGLSEELIDQEKKVVENLKSDNDQLKKHFAKLEVEFHQQTKDKELFEEKQKVETHFNQLKEKEEGVLEKEKQVKEYELYQRDFLPLLKSLKQINAEVKQLEGQLKTATKDAALNDSRLENELILFNNLKVELEQKPLWEKELEDLKIVLEIRALADKRISIEERLQKAETFFKTIENKSQELEQEKKSIREEEKRKKDLLIPVEKLHALRNWYALSVQNNISLQSVKTEIKLLKDKKEMLLKEAKTLLDDNDFELIDLDNCFVEIQKEQVALKNDIEKKSIELADLKVEERLSTFSDHLHDGEACPLCGALEHPNKLSVTSVKEKVLDVEKSIKSLKDSQETLNQKIEGLKNVKIKISHVVESELEKKEIQNSLVLKLEELKKGFVWEGFSPEGEVDFREQEEGQITLQKEIIELSEKYTLQEKLLDDQSEAKRKGETKVRLLRDELNAIIVSESHFNKQLKNLSLDDVESYSVDEIQLKSEALFEKLKKTENQFDLLQTKLQTLEKEKVVLKERISSFTEQLNRLGIKRKGIQKELDATFKQYSTSLEVVIAVLKLQLDTAQIKTEIENFNKEVNRCDVRLSELAVLLKNKAFELAAFNDLEKNLGIEKEKLETSQQELIKKQTELNKIVSDWEQRLAFITQKEALEKRKDQLGVLKKLFHGSGFVNYVSSVYLQQLCEAANTRFYPLTRQTLKLELTDQNTFNVRDYLHDGQVRSVKTLSGGQTFQVSLSLALAMAESIQNQYKNKENFFFLDEGFGTLDKDSLAVVFSTLKALRKENRVVGVISHVEELQQEIETSLLVTNDPEKGSLIQLNTGN